MEKSNSEKAQYLVRKFFHYFNLDAEIDDYDKIHEQISKDSVFKGTNLWILMFAIIVASVGLNMNSTAVIIGAMLISPLMGPINGMGYSIATYNFDLLRKAVKNFIFAVIASLFASTLYFFITPVATAHSELLARTSPTIYDVIIALFGGLAGIVAISSKQKGNVIPGVAIATALMPPLCTAGYGIATAQPEFFLGAFYLFTINTVFIALSSVAVSQLLKFPIRTIIDSAQRSKVNKIISAVTIIVLVPSVYFGYGLVIQEKFVLNANRYISKIGIYEGNLLIKSDIDPKNQSIVLIFGGSNFNDEKKEILINKAADFGLVDAKIKIQQGMNFADYSKEKNSELYTLKEELSRVRNVLIYKTNELDSIKTSVLIGRNIYNEIKSIFPEIVACTYADANLFNDTLKEPERIKMVMFNINKSKMAKGDTIKIRSWLEERLADKKLNVLYSIQK